MEHVGIVLEESTGDLELFWFESKELNCGDMKLNEGQIDTRGRPFLSPEVVLCSDNTI